MLREYISGKIKENEESAIDLEGDIKKLQTRKKELEKLIDIIIDENNDGSEIFSPRNHREQNLDKLKKYREDVEKISQDTEDKLYKLSEVKKKIAEYKRMLAETEKNHLEEEKKYSDIDYQIKNSQNHQTEEEIINTEIKKETEDQPDQIKTSEGQQEVGQSENRDQIKIQTEQKTDNQVEDQPRSEGQQKQIENDSAAYMEKGSEDRMENKKTEPDDQAEEKPEESDESGKYQVREENHVPQSAYEEQKSDSTAMDTKIIIQKSIEEIVKRIEAENVQDKNTRQTKQKKVVRKPSQKYRPEQMKKNAALEQGEIEDKSSKDDMKEIEIKSGELIVLESERRKEKEFLERVKKEVELCYDYSGSKNKCKNGLRKVKRMIEDYISSIEV